MNLEGFSKRGMELGDDPEKISETKNGLRQRYLNAIKRLAQQKMNNDLLFEGLLDAAIRNLSSLGLEVSKESMLKDIRLEVIRQGMSLDYETPSFDLEEPNINVENQSEVEQLKNDLGSIFGFSSVQEHKPISNSGTIPREPAIQSAQPYETTINNTSSQINQSVVGQTLVSNEQEISQQIHEAKEEIKQKLELANQQPNEPTITFTGNLENLSDDVKKRIVQQMDSRGKSIISSIDNIYQEGNYIVVDAKDNLGHLIGTEFTIDDFTKLVNKPSTSKKAEENSQQSTDNMIEPPIQEQPIQQPIQEQPQQINQEESQKILQEQEKQMKSQIINQIMTSMNYAGEFSFGDISISERMNIMQNVQNNLNAKSIDELQMLLATYQEQNVQEDSMGGEKRR